MSESNAPRSRRVFLAAAGTPLCFATLQTRRAGVHVEAVRPNVPSFGKLRIYLNEAVTASTAVAWTVLG